MSENEKRRAIPKWSSIHCGSKSPTNHPSENEISNLENEELLRLARGWKTLSVRNTELNIQNMKRIVTMRLYKSSAESFIKINKRKVRKVSLTFTFRPNSCVKLTFRKLIFFTCTRLSVFFTLNFARVTRQHSSLFQNITGIFESK